jgi:hydroxymethylbilane synthase
VKIRIATRTSKLALAQAHWVARQLAFHHKRRSRPDVRPLEVEFVHITTKGDMTLDKPLYEVGGKGLFVKEIETALIRNDADVAVHSMKDLPAEHELGLHIAAVPEREDPHDVLIADGVTSLQELKPRAKVGTSSLRRSKQLAATRPDLRFEPLRGNVDTRLRKLQQGEYDAIVLAAAGIRRLGLQSVRYHVLSISECMPAAGQGALAIQTRARDVPSTQLVSALDDFSTRIRTEAERACVRALQADCTLPIAAYAELQTAPAHTWPAAALPASSTSGPPWTLRLHGWMYHDEQASFSRHMLCVELPSSADQDEHIALAQSLGASMAERLRHDLASNGQDRG